MNPLNTIKNLALTIIATCCICTLAPAIPPNPIESQDENGGVGTKQDQADVRPDTNGEELLPTSEDWSKIDAFDTHSYSVMIKGWTIVSLDSADDKLLNVYIFDASGNLLESFDSTGCGAFLQLDKPQIITIVVANFQKSPASYKLSVY